MKKRDNTNKRIISLLIFILTVFVVNVGSMDNVNAEVTFSQNYSYTGGEQTLSIPYSGLYKIEVWGAQGGTYYQNTNNYGAYATGVVELNYGTPLYINVGGAGNYYAGARVDYSWNATGSVNQTIQGGYNGGGDAYIGANDQFVNSGGGATHIALVSGELKNLSAHKNDGEILLVAAGGGSRGGWKNGSYYNGVNTAGGFQSNDVGSYCSGCVDKRYDMKGKATQTSGYAFGQGAGGSVGSGGGGYYGGAYGGTSTMSGAGGSSYIASSNLISTDDITKHMTCYSCSTSSEDDIRTISNTCVNSNANTDCSKQGAGYAKLVLIKAYAYLSELSVNKGSLVEDFNPSTFDYTWIVPKNIDTLTDEDIVATPNDPASTVIIPESVPFTQDGDTFEITVIDDNTDRNTYTLTMQRYVSNDGRISSISSDKGQFKQDFDPDTKNYTLEIFEDANTVTLDATALEQDNQGITGIGEITLDDYEKDVEITSTAEDGTVEVYNVHIIKNMYLENVTIEGTENLNCDEGYCTLNPSFEPNIDNYNITVPYEYSKLDLTYIPSHEGLTVGIRVNNTSYTKNMNLAKIKNIIKLNIYNNANEIIKTYTITLKREKENEGKLKSLVVNKGNLVEEFKGNKYEYTWIIPKGVDNLTSSDVTAKLTNKGAILNIPNNVPFTQDGDTFDIVVSSPTVEEFNYSGGEEQYIVPSTGLYKLETWGAQGGGYLAVADNYGAYATGVAYLEIGTTLYINSGGAGSSYAGARVNYSWSATGSVNQTIPGGYNGGGDAYIGANDQFVNSGGGATHIALVSGELKNLSAHKNDGEILLVAAGGGSRGGWKNGSYYNGVNTAGGFQSNDVGSYCSGCVDKRYDMKGKATQTSGYAFGQGAGGSVGSGGGGYYGGAYGGTSTMSGAGGSSYIASSNLISTDDITKHMTGYRVATSNEENTRTLATTCVSATPTADCAKQGSGFAKITMIDVDAEQLTNTYTLTMQRYVSDDARLATLTADKGIFTEEFDKDKDEYVLEMYHKETSVTLDGTPFEQDATVIDGLGEIDLPTDETEHEITVQAEDGTIKVYTVIIRRNMYLEDLGLNGLDDLYCRSYECHLTPTFSPEKVNYDYRVPLDYNTLDAFYEPASAEHRSEMTINGEPYEEGYALPFTGTTVVQVHVYNDSDEIVKTYTMNVIKKYEYKEEFDYTGDDEPYIVPRTGKYKIETWGAQGGTEQWSLYPSYNYGAYSVGVSELTSGDLLHVNVGGQGRGSTGSTFNQPWQGGGGSSNHVNTGGYNGGGDGTQHQNEMFSNSGGGATHIATVPGLLKDLSSYKDTGGTNVSNEILIVSAGGGAKGCWKTNNNTNGYIASGGGYSSNSGSYSNGGGGSGTLAGSTQTSGSSFGLGATGISGGGGGWYGGKTASQMSAGGSSYIASSNLISSNDIIKHMTGYSVATSSEDDTRTQTTACHNQNPIEDCSKEGNGYAKITLLETETMLASLNVDSVELVEDFDKFRTDYTWLIPKGKTEFTNDDIEAVLLHPEKAHIEWPSEPVQYTKDGDTFTFKVVADNGEEDTYTLTMIRQKSDDARLKSLTSDVGILNKEFDPDDNSYVISIFDYTNSITLDAETMDEDAIIVSGIGEIDLDSEITEHEITVTAEDGTTNVYNVTIKVDAYLLYLGLNGLDAVPCVEDECILVPPFEPDSNEYNIKVPYEYTTLDINYLTVNPEHIVKIKVGGAEVTNYSLPVGDTVVTVELYSKDNILLNTYTINVNRNKGNYATLDSLEVSVGDIDIPFDKDITEYTWIIPFDASTNLENYLSYTTTDPAATAELNPSTINYTQDGDTFDIVVTAEDGVTTKTYTITLQQDIIEDIEVEENMLLSVGETKNLYVNGLPDGCAGKFLYEIDQNAIAFVFDNGDVQGVYPGTATITITVKNHPEISKTVNVTVISDKLESDIYEVIDETHDSTDYRMVVGAEDGTTISEFKDNMLNPNEYIKIYDKDGNEVEDDEIVKTGLTIKLEINGTVHDEASMVVKGDVDGDGFINVTDYIAVLNHALALEDIEDYIKFVAGDVAEDEILNVTDYIKIMDYALGNIDSINN